MNGNLKDLAGNSDLTSIFSVQFAEDRHSNANSSILLNGIYLEVPPGVYFNGDFTIMAWVKLVENLAWARLIDCGNIINNNRYDVMVVALSNPTGNITSVYFKDATLEYDLVANGFFQIGKWEHFAMTLSVNHAQIYLNGQLIGESSTFVSPTQVVRSYCFIGRSNWGNVNANGFFDEIKIYNRALSSNEILNDMNSKN